CPRPGPRGRCLPGRVQHHPPPRGAGLEPAVTGPPRAGGPDRPQLSRARNPANYLTRDKVLRPSLVAEAHVNMPLSLRPASIAVHDHPDVAWPRDGQRCRSARRVAEFHDLTVGRTARRRPVSATVSTGSPSTDASSIPSTGHPSRTGVSLAQLSLTAKASGAACSLPPHTPSAVAETASEGRTRLPIDFR